VGVLVIYLRAIASLAGIVPGWIWAAALAASMATGCVHTMQRDSARRDLTSLRADKAIAASEAQRRASAMTRTLQETKDAAIAKAETRAAENADAARGARTELERLRKQAASGAGNAGASLDSCTQYAAAANTVLNECSSALVSLAEVADGHVNDLRTAREAWPEWDKFAGQMTDFTNRLKGMQ
jgi:hypothetical protein